MRTITRNHSAGLDLFRYDGQPAQLGSVSSMEAKILVTILLMILCKTHDLSSLKVPPKMLSLILIFFSMIKGVGVSGEQSCIVNGEEHGHVIHSLGVSLSVVLIDYTPQKSLLSLKEIPETGSLC